MITAKDITDIDVKETVKNIPTEKITLSQSITTVLITKTKIPASNMTLGMTSKITLTFDPGNFEKFNTFV